MKDQIKLDNINLIKALLNEGNKKEFNLAPQKVWAVCYEFYKFYSVYKDELQNNFNEHLKETISKIIEADNGKEIIKDAANDELREFPLFCITAFANAYNNYKEEENEIY